MSRDLYLIEPTHINVIMGTYEIDSCIRGFHVYTAPSLGDEHECQRERGNSEDPYAVQIARSLSVSDDALLTSAGEGQTAISFCIFLC